MPKLFKPPRETYPAGMAPIIRPTHDADGLQCVDAMFGMVPHWAQPKLARQTFNARSETVSSKPSFRNAWSKGQFRIIPAVEFFEPNWESGKAMRWKIHHKAGRPIGIAGIWAWKADQDGKPLLSFSMLTINAEGHSIMEHFHKPGDEKRMVVILEPSQCEGWLAADKASAPELLKQYPAEQLVAEPAPKPKTTGDQRKVA